jgi:solute:Na+ symporter, SSS family
MNPLFVIAGYLVLLVALGFAASRFFSGTSQDYFVASRSVGPFLLAMSVFGTTMTAFALVGSTGEAFERGIGVYGLMASWSGLVHSAVFFFVGVRLWAVGRRHNLFTQIQYFRARFESDRLGYLLFPILVGLVIPYLLIGILGAGAVVAGLTSGMFPSTFPSTEGAVPGSLTGLVICVIVLSYVFFGGFRGAIWANTFQTLVFMLTGLVAFHLIAGQLGGLRDAAAAVAERAPHLLVREGQYGHLQFMTYFLIPISVGMFPHVFQHWLTARSARTFRLSVVAQPLFIMVVWVPCILIGVWAAGLGLDVTPNAVLGSMVALIESPFLSGLLTAGILAAIMSSLDSQFVCLGTMFTHDIVIHRFGERRVSDRQRTWLGRCFIAMIVVVTYLFSLAEPRAVFGLGVWCFAGFAGLFPLVVGSLYWRRTTKSGAVACVLVTAATWLLLFAVGDLGREEVLVGGLAPVAVIFAASAATIVLVSLLTRPPSEATVAAFFPSRRHRTDLSADANVSARRTTGTN